MDVYKLIFPCYRTLVLSIVMGCLNDNYTMNAT